MRSGWDWLGREEWSNQPLEAEVAAVGDERNWWTDDGPAKAVDTANGQWHPGSRFRGVPQRLG